jgi:hypothetical protein
MKQILTSQRAQTASMTRYAAADSLRAAYDAALLP